VGANGIHAILMIRPLTGVLLYVALFAACLFLPAPTLHWRAAWILLAVLLVVRGASAMRLWSTQRELVRERWKLPLHRDQVGIDRPLLIACMAAFAAVIVFCSYDRWRLHLFAPLPTVIRVAGLVLFVLGWWLVHLALTANRFAVTVVRHQEDRGQSVVDHGVYGVVRHPMYAGVSLVIPGLALWLGSAAGVIACAVPLSLFALRIIVEERMLRTHLEGYADYARRVRFRLLPGVW
jgi:protein-S-isoprenylcysteine O-methyltransferase Ste14